jgi:hypothetical protein
MSSMPMTSARLIRLIAPSVGPQKIVLVAVELLAQPSNAHRVVDHRVLPTVSLRKVA